MKFKPMLATDATDNLDTIQYSKYASYKLDGIRCIFHPELGMVTRSLKKIPNVQLNAKFEMLTKISKAVNIVLDGELYAHELTFQEITRAVMTQDFDDEKTLKKLIKERNFIDTDEAKIYAEELLYPIKFYCFDTFSLDKPMLLHTDGYDARKRLFDLVAEKSFDNIVFVAQTIVNNKDNVEKMFKFALDDGYEGLILKDINTPYKFGRSTLKEEYLLKVKPFKTFDAKIIGVKQATEVREDAEKKTNELGRSVTSQKKDDRVLIEKASCFIVKYGEHTVKPSLAMTDEEKEEVWRNKENYIGRMIEYHGMVIGMKDKPRHPTFIRFREDRD